MKRFSDRVYEYKLQNPFSDSQARNFSDAKVSNEFCPISSFWTLFNDQHEVLLGSRGCGKTFLLKMMRYSMLKKIDDPRAKVMAENKEFIGVYVPMHLEFVTLFNDKNLTIDQQVLLFQCAFNCLLAESLIVELKSLIEDESDSIKRAKKTSIIVKKLDEIWFNIEDSEVYEFETLRNKINKIFYNIDWKSPEISSIPVIFKKKICSSLSSVKTVISQLLDWKEEPTWIVCIDEAEFLNETLQKCINSMFRSDTGRIALKIATLPYFHKTLETQDPGITVVNGNDFTYRVIDMKHNSSDYKNLTNSLCAHRLETRFDETDSCKSLEEFLGVIGNDDQIDFYRNQFGDECAQREIIENKIIESFSEKRRGSAKNYLNRRKTIYDKYAPIFFVREMHNLSKRGNAKPGWFVGATVVRKVSQGNPRLFIQLMSELFERARSTKLEPKIQSEVIFRFSENICRSTMALESQGPIMYEELKKIAEYMHEKTHGAELITTSSAFILKYSSDQEFANNKEWLQLAIAYSRLSVDDDVIINGITEKTRFILANTYATAYWLPMRGDSPTNISLSGNTTNKYIVNNNSRESDKSMHQMSLFEEGSEW